MELSINNLIKLIIGILVVGVVVASFAIFFKEKIIDVFNVTSSGLS